MPDNLLGYFQVGFQRLFTLFPESKVVTAEPTSEQTLPVRELLALSPF